MTDAIFKCDCHLHCIVATRSHDAEDDDWGNPGDVELAFWRMGDTPPGWRWRLRQCWRALRRGSPYEDWVDLDKETADAFGRWLLSRDATLISTLNTGTNSHTEFTGRVVKP